MSPDRRDCYGVIRDYTEFTEDIRFGTCSEVNINVPKKHYDTEKGCWIDNPYYHKLVKGNLLYLADDTPYFGYKYTKPYVDDDNNGYSILSTQITNRSRTTPSFDVNSGLNNFKVQKEVLLFDVGSRDGYHWQSFSEITNGKFKSFPHYWSSRFYKLACEEFFPIKPYDIIVMRNRGNNDMGNWYNATDETVDIGNDVDYQYLYVHFYTDADATTYVGSINMGYNVGNPIYRTSISNLPDSDSYSSIKEQLKDGGYVRFSLICNRHRPNSNSDWNINYNSWYKKTTRTENGESVTTQSYQCNSPADGYVRIYSGERRCTSINTNTSGSAYSLFMRWFVIDSVQEAKEGLVDIKTIKAYSYEYTLKNRTITLPDETIALYVPKKITDIVNGDNWVIDKVERKDGSNNTITSIDTAPQYMLTGLLNRILEALPHWSIGHISSELQAKYRAFSNIDNTSIYNFLMQDVQQAYQCYFVFDNDSLTISAYSHNDIKDTNNHIYLTWENAIKRMTLTNEKSEKITALRVHTAEDTYGLGLVNPYGSSMIYNFSTYFDQMDFVADDSDDDPWGRNKVDDGNGGTRNRTLKEAVDTMQNFAKSITPNVVIPTCVYCGALLGFENHGYYCNVCGGTISGGINPNYINISSLDDYKNYATKFVETNMEYIKIMTKEQELLTEYRTIVDKINVYLQEDHETNYEYYILSDVPVKPSDLPTDYTEAQYKTYYHSTGFFAELKSASQSYYDVYYQVHNDYYSGDLTVKYKKELYYNILCKVAQKLNLNYAKQVENVNIRNAEIDDDVAEINSSVFPSILTPAEIMALQPFIIEGDWTNQNAIFSETYGADDIIETLNEVHTQATDELRIFYSQENYEFEIDLINWLALTEFEKQLKLLRVGRPICHINTEDNKWISPHLLELHLNYTDKDDFKMTFNTDYNQKTLSYRFADLYNSINQVSLSDNTFTFNE